MDREQKIRFLKEIVSSSQELKKEDNPEFNKLRDNLEKGFFSLSEDNQMDLNLSEEQFDEVVSESPWIIDAVFDFVEKFNSDEEVDFGQEESFKMKSLYFGIQDLMEKYKEFEDEQKL